MQKWAGASGTERYCAKVTISIRDFTLSSLIRTTQGVMVSSGTGGLEQVGLSPEPDVLGCCCWRCRKQPVSLQAPLHRLSWDAQESRKGLKGALCSAPGSSAILQLELHHQYRQRLGGKAEDMYVAMGQLSVGEGSEKAWGRLVSRLLTLLHPGMRAAWFWFSWFVFCKREVWLVDLLEGLPVSHTHWVEKHSPRPRWISWESWIFSCSCCYCYHTVVLKRLYCSCFTFK